MRVKILTSVFILFFYSQLLGQCLISQLNFQTNNTDWILLNNNISYPNGTYANIINPINIAGVYWWDSTASGDWISCLGTGIHPTNGIGPNQSMTFRYEFTVCGYDTIDINMQVFRDNFCNLYVDNNLVFSDPQITPTNQINLNVGTFHNFYIVNFTNVPTIHSIDFEIIDFNILYSLNGWGGKLNGLLKSRSNSNSLISNNPACANVSCCSNPPVIQITGDTTICLGQSTSLTASAGSANITWSGGINNGTAFAPTGTTSYVVTATDVNGCTNTSAVTVNVLPQPNIQILANPGTVICEGNLITLTAIGGLQYQWSGGIQNGIPFLPNQSSIYAVVASDINGCTNQSTVSIQIDTMSNIQVSASNRINCEQLSAVLTASGGQQYTWQPIAGLSASQGAQVIASPTSTNTYTVTVQSGACQDTASISVQVDDITFATISIANVFTPNDDGVNDIVHVLSNTPLFNFMWTIYNRWGQKVFETDQINEGWNGIYNGQPALADTYYYVVQYQTACKKTIKKGDLILIR